MVKSMILEFEYYLKRGVVKKSIKDVKRAVSLLKTARKRMEIAEKIEVRSFRLEFVYEAIIELIEALMSLEGYKSYSHEADIAFLRKVYFSENIILKLDEVRRNRHRSKYYGVELKIDKAEELIKFCKNVFKKLESLVENKIREVSR